MKKLAKKFLKYDMFPLGNYENNPIEKTSDWYEECMIIELDTKVDNSKLYKDFKRVRCNLDDNYVTNRREILEKNNVDIEELLQVFSEHGFNKDVYNSFPIHELGSSNLINSLEGSYTQLFFSRFEGKQHRQQYSTSYDGWSLAYHKDHANFLDHGFRLMTPLNKSAYFSFLDDNFNQYYFKLVVGKCYFVNVTKFHRAFSMGGERVLLRWQSNTDKNIIGNPLKTYSESKIPAHLRLYKFDKDFWTNG